MTNKSVKVGLVGLGTVGSGVVKMLKRNPSAVFEKSKSEGVGVGNFFAAVNTEPRSSFKEGYGPLFRKNRYRRNPFSRFKGRGDLTTDRLKLPFSNV